MNKVYVMLPVGKGGWFVDFLLSKRIYAIANVFSTKEKAVEVAIKHIKTYSVHDEIKIEEKIGSPAYGPETKCIKVLGRECNMEYGFYIIEREVEG